MVLELGSNYFTDHFFCKLSMKCLYILMGSSGSAPHFSSLVLFCLLQYSNCFSSYILCHHRNIAQTLSPGPWHEYCVNDITVPILI